MEPEVNGAAEVLPEKLHVMWSCKEGGETTFEMLPLEHIFNDRLGNIWLMLSKSILCNIQDQNRVSFRHAQTSG